MLVAADDDLSGVLKPLKTCSSAVIIKVRAHRGVALFPILPEICKCCAGVETWRKRTLKNWL